MEQTKVRRIMFIVFLVVVLIIGYWVGVNSLANEEQKQMNGEVSYIADYVKKILELKVPYEETEGTPFEIYNDISRYPNAIAKAKIKYKAQLIGDKGVVNVVYWQDIYEMNGIFKKHLHGCEGIQGKWELENVDNEWRVVSVSEEP